MKTTYRYIIIAIILLGAIYYLLPQNNNINLGLDLKGGMHVILGVQVDRAVEAKLNSIVSQLKRDLLDKSVDYAYIRKVGNKIEIALKKDNSELAKSIIDKNYPYFELSSWQESEKKLTFVLSEDEAERIKNYAVDQALQVVRNRVDEFGVTEPVIQKQGQNQLLVQLPGITDPKRALELIGKTAQLEFYLVDEDIDMRSALSGNIPPDDIVLYQKIYDDQGREINKIPYPLKRPPVLTGEYLSDAEVRISPQYNQPYVMIRFDAVGSKLFEEITSNNVGKKLAIVLDDQVYSAPVIREAISGGIAQITGDFAMQEARDLAVVLRAGSLPAPVEILENRTVGPSLGKDSIESGIKAAIIALIIVIIFLAYYYKLAGIFANIALVLNLVLVLSVMSMFGATLTLPGIAGLILTVGMSVDANVLIDERIREEILLGRTTINAIESGFSNAMSAIIDANVTTLVAAVVLYQFGTGPIKGFAVTLSIGILASLFTAIFVTKTFFQSVYYNKKRSSISI